MTAGIFWPRTHNASGTPTVPASQMIIGCNWHGTWAEQSNDTTRGQILDKIVSWGAKSVRLDYAWSTIEGTKGSYSWTALDELINDAYTRGLSVCLLMYWAPQWSSGSTSKTGVPGNFADYGNILGMAGARYGSKLAAIEMWNEPNIDTFWAGTRTQFRQMLATAYPIAKAASPGTTYIAGAPTYLGLADGWLSEMYQNPSYMPGISYDAQGIHPYMSPMDTAPDDPDKTNWSIRAIEDLQVYRAGKGDTSPLWATEFGWSTHANVGGELNWMRGITEAEQADWVPKAYSMMANYGVRAAYIYTEKDMSQTSEPHERNYGLTRVDYSEKPVVARLRAVYTSTGAPPPTAAVVGGSSFQNIGGGGATGITMALPTGLQDGDLVFVAAICSDSSAGCVITENKNGWTTITSKADVGTMQRTLYRAVYSSSLVAPSWTLSSQRKLAYACVGIRFATAFPFEDHSDGGGLVSVAPGVTSAPRGLGLRFYVRKDNLSTTVASDAGMTPITGGLGVATGPSVHILAYTTQQATAGAMATATTTWPLTSVNSTAWTISV